jgi:hypothetical protein
MRTMKVSELGGLLALLERYPKKEASGSKLLGSQDLIKYLSDFRLDSEWLKRAMNQLPLSRLLEILRYKNGDSRVRLVSWDVLLSAWDILSKETITGDFQMAVMMVLHDSVNIA